MAATVTWTKELAMPESTFSSNRTSQRRVREWEVCLSAADATGPDIAVTGTGIPAVGAQYGSTALRVQTLTAKLKERNNRKVYTVTAEYGIAETSGGSPVTTDPWDRDKSYSYGSIEYEYDLEIDWNPDGAEKVVNTAGECYAGPIGARKINLLITVNYAKKVADYNPVTESGRIGSVNGDTVTINGDTWSAQQVLCRTIRADKQTWISSAGTETAYYQISEEYECCSVSDTHTIKVISKGYRELVGGVLTKIKGNDGKDIARPALLDEDGAETTTPYIQTFYPYPSSNWSKTL